ncbi:MAG TPA: serine/threonine-protein kinase [Polyangia bacterium]
MTPPSAFETRHTYTIHDKIASGGMGTIRLGLQLVPSGFSRVVAIKQIHSMYANNQEFVAMFRDEFRVASRVVHPNVVPILDVMSGDDELSLVMEYVHGLSVARLVTSAGQAPSPEIATTIVIGMLHGLHAAHEALSEKGEHLNVVHRDVTPHNVMVGVDGTPRLLDFGIAHALGRSRTTTVGQIKGKAKYLAPEQLTGASIDRRADIYSASVVFWEMLTGRRLFRPGNDDPVLDLAARDSVKSPHLIRPGISPHLSRIVLRGLQPDPAARYRTALEMAVALEEGAATVSATKVGEWVKRVWGPAGLARLQRIRAIEGGVEEAPGSEDHEKAGRDHEQATANGEVAVVPEPSEAQMTVPERPVGRRLAPAARAEPTISWGPDDSLFGPRPELPPLVARQGREPKRKREETPVNGQVSSDGLSRSKSASGSMSGKSSGRAVTLTVLVALGSAVALLVVHGGGLPTPGEPNAAKGEPASDLRTIPPVRISSVPVIEMTTPATPSPPPPSVEPASPPENTRDAPPPAPAPAVARAEAPSSEQRMAPAPRRRSAPADRAKPRGAAKIARSPSGSRKGKAAAAAEKIEKAAGEAGTSPPPAAPAPSCDPPYVIDDDGIKHFKLSCL